MHTTSVDQKILTIVAHRSTEMIGDAFVIVKSGRPAKYGSQLFARLLVIHTSPQLHLPRRVNPIPIRQENREHASLNQLHLRAT